MWDMIRIGYLLFEIMAVLQGLKCYYGKKTGKKIYDAIMILSDVAIMEGIMEGMIPSFFTITPYIMLFLYCGLNYGFEVKKISINLCLGLGMTCVCQFIFSCIYCMVFQINTLDYKAMLCINIGIFLLYIFLLPKLKPEKISVLFQKINVWLGIPVLVCVTFFAYGIYLIRTQWKIPVFEILLLIVCYIMTVVLMIRICVAKVKRKQAEKDLKIYKDYAESFSGLIEQMRMRQHEFDNHIHTIYSQHVLYQTYGELVTAQKEYCELVMSHNKFQKLLCNGNSAIIGFLYGKFVQFEKMGIPIEYHINIQQLSGPIPIHIYVEILGILLNNAVEYYLQKEMHALLKIWLIESKDNIYIKTASKLAHENDMDLDMFFQKGYSKKGKNRGWGLYHVKHICEEYGLNIVCETEEFESEAWLVFKLNIPVKNRKTIFRDTDIPLKTAN